MEELGFEKVLEVVHGLLGQHVTVQLAVEELTLATLGGEVQSAGEVRDRGHFVVWLTREQGHESVILYSPPIFERAGVEEGSLVVVQAGVRVTFGSLLGIGAGA